MTPDTQARAGYRRSQVRRAESGTTIRSGEPVAEAARTGQLPSGSYREDQADMSVGGLPSRAAQRAVRRTREDVSIVKVIRLLAVLVVTAAGVYIAWDKGSAGGGEGGVVAGAALLTAAVARLVLPTRLVGLLATRKRAIDVVTLTVFGAALLVVGLVLPR
jgi:hypothetical protein